MIKILKENKIILFNIILIVVLLCFFCCFINKYAVLYIHGYIYPWLDTGLRFGAKFYETLLNNILPVIFNSNPNDFRSGLGLGSVILGLLYLFICYMFVKGFFLSNEKRENIFLKKSLMFILPFIFLMLFVPIKDYNDKYLMIYRLNDFGTSAEYFFCLLPMLIFSMVLYDICIKGYKPKNIFVICFYVVISYLLGNYNELVNITIFSFLFIFGLLLFIVDRQKLLNKQCLFMIVPFFVGMVQYYIFSDTASSMVSFYDIQISSCIKNLQSDFLNIAKAFISTMFVSKWVLYFLFFVLIAILKVKKHNYKYCLVFVVSLLGGYILANLASVLTGAFSLGNEYLFERSILDRLYVNIIEFVLLVLAGILYEDEKSRKWILMLLVLSSIFFMYLFSQHYPQREKYLIELKPTIYELDKINLVYTVLGESAIIPEKYLAYESIKNSEIFKFEQAFDIEDRYQKDKYINAEYFHYDNYFNRIYNQNYIGAIFKDDEFAKKELDTRLMFFDDKMETKEELIKNKFNFNKMYKKYKGLKLTIDDIEKMERKYGSSPVLDKAKAFICFNNQDWAKSKELYEKYLLEYPKDVDAMIHIAEIYKINKQYKNAEKVYLALIEWDKNNLMFLYKLLCLYFYELCDYEKAIKINSEIIKIVPNSYCAYINMAIMQSFHGNREYAQKCLLLAQEKNPMNAENWLKWNDIENLDKENIILEYPGF